MAKFRKISTLSLFIFSFIFIICYEYFLKDISSWWPRADVSGYITSILGYGYIASYIVYILTVYIPQKIEKEKNYEYIRKQLGFLIKDFNDINYFFDNRNALSIDVETEIYDYTSDPQPLIKYSEELIDTICNSISPSGKAPTMRLAYINEKFETQHENWGELLKRKAIMNIDRIKSLYQFSHLLDIEDIKLLNKIEYSSYIQTVYNFDSGIGALHFKRENWDTLSVPMYEYYLLLKELSIKFELDKININL